MGRYKNNPDYDAVVLSRRLMDSLVHDYNNPGSGEAVPGTEKMQITKLAKKHNISVLKVRKLLVSAGALKNEKTIQIHRLKAEGKGVSEIVKITGLSKASISSYLPYSKIIYKMEEVSPNAIRIDSVVAPVSPCTCHVSPHLYPMAASNRNPKPTCKDLLLVEDPYNPLWMKNPHQESHPRKPSILRTGHRSSRRIDPVSESKDKSTNRNIHLPSSILLPKQESEGIGISAGNSSTPTRFLGAQGMLQSFFR